MKIRKIASVTTVRYFEEKDSRKLCHVTLRLHTSKQTKKLYHLNKNFSANLQTRRIYRVDKGQRGEEEITQTSLHIHIALINSV